MPRQDPSDQQLMLGRRYRFGRALQWKLLLPSRLRVCPQAAAGVPQPLDASRIDDLKSHRSMRTGIMP